MHLGGEGVLGHQGNHKNGPAEGTERMTGTKLPGDDRGGPLAQER